MNLTQKKKDLLKQEWLKLSSPWIKETREGRNSHRNGLLDQPMLEACGYVEGLRILDCGCGEGRFCRTLAQRGASYVLGLDICESMIKAAKELQPSRNEYRIADVQNLSFLADQSFDLVFSYLNQCDLPDFMANTREVYRILRNKGRFVIANLHPMRSAGEGWYKSEDGLKQHVILDRYFEEDERHWRMMGVSLTNFHRTLSTYIQGFIEVGFNIEAIIEPTLDKKKSVESPDLLDELRVPNFIIYCLNKPSDQP